MLGQSLKSFEAFSWVFLIFNGRYWYVFVIIDVIWYIFRILVRWLRICKLKEHILKVNWNISVFPKWPFDSVIHVWRHTQKGFSKPIRSILNDARCHSTRHSICLYSRVYHLHTWRHIVSFSRFKSFLTFYLDTHIFLRNSLLVTSQDSSHLLIQTIVGIFAYL